MMADRSLRLVLGVVVSVVTARYLGPRGFGQLMFATVVMNICGVAGAFGIPDVSLRRLASGGETAEEDYANALTLRVLGSIIGASAAIAIGMFSKGGDFATTAVVALCLIPMASDVIDVRFQADAVFVPLVILRFVPFVIFALAKILAPLIGANLWVFGAMYLGEACLAAVLVMTYERYIGKNAKSGRASLSGAAELFTECLPLGCRNLCINVYMRADQFIIPLLLTAGALGVYSVAVRISEVWYFLPTAIVAASTPYLIKREVQSAERFAEDLTRQIRYLTWAAVLASATISILSPLIIHFAYGSRFAAGATVLSVHSWVGVFVSLGVASSPWYLIRRKLVAALWQAFISAICAVLVVWILLVHIGIVGAAVGALVSYCFSSILVNAIFPSTRELFWIQVEALTFYRRGHS